MTWQIISVSWFVRNSFLDQNHQSSYVAMAPISRPSHRVHKLIEGKNWTLHEIYYGFQLMISDWLPSTVSIEKFLQEQLVDYVETDLRKSILSSLFPNQVLR